MIKTESAKFYDENVLQWPNDINSNKFNYTDAASCLLLTKGNFSSWNHSQYLLHWCWMVNALNAVLTFPSPNNVSLMLPWSESDLNQSMSLVLQNSRTKTYGWVMTWGSVKRSPAPAIIIKKLMTCVIWSRMLLLAVILLVLTLEIGDIGEPVCVDKLYMLDETEEESDFIAWLVRFLQWNSIPIVNVFDERLI